MTDSFSRRRVLSYLAAGAACPVCASLAGRAFGAEDKAAHAAAGADKAAGHGGGAPHWGYVGAGGPDNWGTLSADFKVCDLGLEQTPIDLASTVRAELAGVESMFQDSALTVVNNGHTIQANCAAGNYSLIGGERFELLQFHFHHPSEHKLAGQAFPLECHFVHRSQAGTLAVLGVFIRAGAANDALEVVFQAMPAAAGGEQPAARPLNPNALLPFDRGHFRYAGSLTTPPCSEGVNWVVFKTAIEASDAQIQKFAAMFPLNARPIQKQNRRFLLESL